MADQPVESAEWDATFAAAERDSLRRGMEASPEARLAWIEEMLEFAQRARLSSSARLEGDSARTRI